MGITRRIYISSTGCSLYVDVARLAPGDHYLVGTMCLPAECAPSLKLDLLEAVTPPRGGVPLPLQPAPMMRELFAGEEVQLLRSIDVGPDDEEVIATYRNGATEAEMEWLPFLRMVSALFLQGVEQGVYARTATVDP